MSEVLKIFNLPSSEGEEEYRLNWVGKKQLFEEDDAYGVPAGEHFVIATLSADFAGPYDTVMAIIIDNGDGKTQVFNFE